ncbi:hypothetical protein AArcSl_0643 [Halalkaliarchaeum desulfuricum]|uniref:Uncharacterized protein n=1 Tax=Halalkaliarchaeum desulfuricum TaxID=2055893 RepID=A0A343TGS1_9EURY|nr:hypothetical protein [Halalkaliarchaeum desulfuricum]AUX08293.1 hypothetical protein AArcSl_0643 [Halalkaliarchaeum desulfuricum]
MTDASIPITQSVVEDFTERYLRSLGCQVNVKTHAEEWEITIPSDVDTKLPRGEFTLVCDSTEGAGEDAELLHPESSFFQRVLDDAADRAPVGNVTIESADTDVIIPDWLRESDVEVTDVQFTPYYDRSALVILFRVSVETVSEYQQEFLRGIGIDVRSGEVLPNIDGTLLDLTKPGNTSLSTSGVTIDPERIKQLVDASRESLVSDIRPMIDEIHREASRAADAELEEYRQLQQQREEELEAKLGRLQSQIEDLSKTIENVDQEDRVEVLQERRELRSELEEMDADLTELRRRREQGYPNQQREIRDRHALEVIVTPVTVTEVQYERGDIEFELADDVASVTLTIGYGSGVGVTEDIDCDLCNRPLSREIQLATVNNGIQCMDCS